MVKLYFGIGLQTNVKQLYSVIVEVSIQLHFLKDVFTLLECNYAIKLLASYNLLNLVFLFSDGHIKEWDLNTLSCLRKLKCHEGAVNDLEVNDIKIITCGGDSLVKIWEMTTPIDKIPKEMIQNN